jgi:hypothetical protein
MDDATIKIWCVMRARACVCVHALSPSSPRPAFPHAPLSPLEFCPYYLIRDVCFFSTDLCQLFHFAVSFDTFRRLDKLDENQNPICAKSVKVFSQKFDPKNKAVCVFHFVPYISRVHPLNH